jgi:hypothetical protein
MTTRKKVALTIYYAFTIACALAMTYLVIMHLTQGT